MNQPGPTYYTDLSHPERNPDAFYDISQSEADGKVRIIAGWCTGPWMTGARIHVTCTYDPTMLGAQDWGVDYTLFDQSGSVVEGVSISDQPSWAAVAELVGDRIPFGTALNRCGSYALAKLWRHPSAEPSWPRSAPIAG